MLSAPDDGGVAAATASSGADAGGVAGDAAVAEAEPAVNPELEAFQLQFAAVQENTGDFNGWCSVISAAEKLVRPERHFQTSLERLLCTSIPVTSYLICARSLYAVLWPILSL